MGTHTHTQAHKVATFPAPKKCSLHFFMKGSDISSKSGKQCKGKRTRFPTWRGELDRTQQQRKNHKFLLIVKSKWQQEVAHWATHPMGKISTFFFLPFSTSVWWLLSMEKTNFFHSSRIITISLSLSSVLANPCVDKEVLYLFSFLNQVFQRKGKSCDISWSLSMVVSLCSEV